MYKDTNDGDELNIAYRKIKNKILPLLFFCFMFSYIDRMNISFAKIQMGHDLSFSNYIYGLGAGIFFIGYVLFEIPSNLLLSRFGAKLFISRIMITWGIVSAATLFVTTPMQFYIMRFMLGVAEAGFFPGIILYLTYWFPSHKIRSVTALFIMSIPASGIVGGLLSGVILDIFSDSKLMRSWQWLFLIEGIPSIFMGLIVFKYLPNGIASAKWLSDRDKYLLDREIKKDFGCKSTLNFFDLLKDWQVWSMIAMGCCFSIGMYGIIFWLPMILKESGISDGLNVSLVSAIPWGTSILCMLILSRLKSSKTNKHYYVVIPSMLGALGLIMSVFFASNIVLAILFLSIATSGVMCVFPGFWSLTSFLGGVAAVIGIALIIAMSNIAGFISPTLIGHIIDQTKSTSSAVLLMALFIIIGGLIAYVLPIGRKYSEQ